MNETIVSEINSAMNTDNLNKSLEGDYIEEPWNITESYFKGQHLERLVRHQIESYNNFVECQIEKTIECLIPCVSHRNKIMMPIQINTH